MKKSKFAKTLVLGMCITVVTTLTTSFAFAQTDTGTTSDGAGVSGRAGQSSAYTGSQKDGDILLYKMDEPENMSSPLADELAPDYNREPATKEPFIGGTADDLGNTNQIAPVDRKIMQPNNSPNAATNAMDLPASMDISDELYQKQRTIDKYLFEDHVEDIQKSGFEVTSTAAYETYVEIGILPYSETNAEYLYNLFGKDDVKVVEGFQSVPLIYLEGQEIAGVEEDSFVITSLISETGMVTDVTNSTNTAKSAMIMVLAGAAGIVILGAAVIVIRRRRVAGR